MKKAIIILKAFFVSLVAKTLLASVRPDGEAVVAKRKIATSDVVDMANAKTELAFV
jgi:hypothetical protein